MFFIIKFLSPNVTNIKINTNAYYIDLQSLILNTNTNASIPFLELGKILM